MERKYKKDSHKGMTLVEIMVVLVIIGLMFSGVIFGMGSLEKERLRSSVMSIAAAFRFAYAQSAITGKGYRIVLDLDNNLFYMEEAEPGRILISEDEDEEKEEEEYQVDVEKEAKNSGIDLETLMLQAQDMAFNKAQQKQNIDMDLLNQITNIEVGKPGEDDTPRYKRPRFHKAKGKAGQKHPLEQGIEFEKIYATHYKYPKEEGKAYIYFFPGGDAEHAVVQLRTGSGIIHSIEVLPLTGEIKTYDIPIELEEYGEEVE